MLEENQFNVQGYNIVNILKRLEHATSRLEEITQTQEGSYKTGTTAIGSADNQSESGSSPLEISPVPRSPEKVKFVREFEDLIKSHVEPFVELSSKIDSVVGEVAGNFKDAFVAQTRFLNIVSQTKKPDFSDPAFSEALKPMNEKIGAISATKDANRRSEFFNHLNTLSDGAPVLGWIVSETPVSFIPEIKDSAQFWANRVIKDFKDKDAVHAEWVKSFLAVFDALRTYVKEFHTTGPSWNSKGKSLKESLATSDSTSNDTKLAAPDQRERVVRFPVSMLGDNVWKHVARLRCIGQASSHRIRAKVNCNGHAFLVVVIEWLWAWRSDRLPYIVHLLWRELGLSVCHFYERKEF